jgi:hypothetical protein
MRYVVAGAALVVVVSALVISKRFGSGIEAPAETVNA